MSETSKPETALCWDLSRHNEHGYWKLHLHAFVSLVVPVQRLIDGAVDRTQWNSPETALRMEAFYRRVLAEGYSVVYERPFGLFSSDDSFRLSWQEYEPSGGLDARSRGYTGHKIIQLGNDTYDGAVKGLALLDRVRKSVKRVHPDLGDGNSQLDDPRFVVSALERTKGVVRTARIDRSMNEPLTLVEDRSRRGRLRSEGVLSMFGH